MVTLMGIDFPISEQRNVSANYNAILVFLRLSLMVPVYLPMIWLVFTIKGLVMTLINFFLFAVPSGYVDQTTKAAIVNAAYFKVNFA